jgi:NADPH2:quinone reductase
LTLTRPSLSDYIVTREEFVSRATAVFEGVLSGALKIAISKKFPLKEAAEAHRYLECK